jgi:hypothetical protein
MSSFRDSWTYQWIVYGKNTFNLTTSAPAELRWFKYPLSKVYTTYRGALYKEELINKYGDIETGLKAVCGDKYESSYLEEARRAGLICQTCTGCKRCVEETKKRAEEENRNRKKYGRNY